MFWIKILATFIISIIGIYLCVSYSSWLFVLGISLLITANNYSLKQWIMEDVQKALNGMIMEDRHDT